MVNITLSVPDELKRKMDVFEEMNWSAVARKAFAERIEEMEFIKKFKSKSTMTEEEAIELGKKLNKELAKRRN